MAVTLLTLLKAAPMKEETRQKLLAGLETLSEAQKEKLSAACWTALNQTYFARLYAEIKKYQLDCSENKKQYNVKDLEEIEKKLTDEYVQKLTTAESETELETVRQELKTQLTAPTPPTTPTVN